MTAGTAIVLALGIGLLVVGLLVWKWRPADVCTTVEAATEAAHRYIKAIEFLPPSAPKHIEATRIFQKQVPSASLRKEAFLRASAEVVRKAGAEAHAAAKNGGANRG